MPEKYLDKKICGVCIHVEHLNSKHSFNLEDEATKYWSGKHSIKQSNEPTSSKE